MRNHFQTLLSKFNLHRYNTEWRTPVYIGMNPAAFGYAADFKVGRCRLTLSNSR